MRGGLRHQCGPEEERRPPFWVSALVHSVLRPTGALDEELTVLVSQGKHINICLSMSLLRVPVASMPMAAQPG